LAWLNLSQAICGLARTLTFPDLGQVKSLPSESKQFCFLWPLIPLSFQGSRPMIVSHDYPWHNRVSRVPNIPIKRRASSCAKPTGLRPGELSAGVVFASDVIGPHGMPGEPNYSRRAWRLVCPSSLLVRRGHARQTCLRARCRSFLFLRHYLITRAVRRRRCPSRQRRRLNETSGRFQQGSAERIHRLPVL
jgi:hypothetical protein